MFKFTVLGCSASRNSTHQDAFGNDLPWFGSSYLLESDTAKVLLDAGNGSMSALTARRLPGGVPSLDAIVITHEHADHFADLYSVWVAMTRHISKHGGSKIPLFAPEAVFEAALKDLEKKLPAPLELAFECHVIPLSNDPADLPTFQVGDLIFTSAETIHPVKTVAVEVEHEPSGAVLLYSSDTGPGFDARVFPHSPHVFLCEATSIDPETPHFGHLSGRQAGEMATEIGAKILYLTHMHPFYEEEDRQAVKERAAEVFSGPILIAEPFLSFTLDSGLSKETEVGSRVLPGLWHA
jgi:ribonuclease BN (tRNA processing enzyme)